MKTRVYIVWDDFYHPSSVLEPLVNTVFDPEKFDVTTSLGYESFFEKEWDLLVQFTIGAPVLTEEQEADIVARVENGMGILAFHAGLVISSNESLFLTKLNTGNFICHPARADADPDDPHPEQCDVRIIPLTNVKHPVTEGVEPFNGWDEHYFVKMDVGATELLAASTSVHGTTSCVWAHERGNGRIVCITQGHNPCVVENPNMIRLVNNAIAWAKRGANA